MTTEIYYFTGTGNSLNIAKSIEDKLKDCELIPIAKIWQKESLMSTSDKVGFVFPLYYSGLPKIVYDFISKIDVRKSNYFFAVIATGGDITALLPLQQINNILKSKERTLSTGLVITMPNNYIIGYDIHSELRQKEFFEKAQKQIEEISEIIANKGNNLTQEIFEKNLSRAERFNGNFRKVVNEGDKAFYAEESCTSCGVCEEICPVSNIELIDGKPTWLHKCQQCLACINFCPEKSIQFGTQTKKTQRYHHPDITLKEIINQKG
ncbi:MAG: EFR1 family ferrodoxin [Promethearchaeota archaeon]|jgi:formate hydrogenlyase subunit 6/NADH:ubiquinone oxidoreductase subunit I